MACIGRLAVRGTRATMLVGWALAGLATAATAQDPISPDRPGLDFSPFTVGPGVVQIEIGLPALTYDGISDVSTWVVQTPTLVRVGVTPTIELRAGLSPFNSVSINPAGTADSFTEQAFGDLEVGAKFQLRDASGSGPAVALIPSLTFPTGGEPFTADGVGFLFNAVAGFSVADAVGLAAVGGLYYTHVGEDEYDVSGLAALVASRSLSERVGSFVEFGVLPREGASAAVLVGGGLTFPLSPDVQLDLYIDRGVNSETPDWQFGTGAAFRF